MNSKTSLWLADSLASLTILCGRADRIEGRITPPWWVLPDRPGIPLRELLDLAEPARLLTDVQAHPIYQRLSRDVPRLETTPTKSPFDAVRRARVIAGNMAEPITRKRLRTSSRPDKKRDRELKAIQRLQRVTSSPLRQRILGEWAAQELHRLPVAFGKIAHPAVWFLALDLWREADTASAQLLLEAAPLVDPAGCDDSTARRYIKQAQKIIPRRPKAIRLAPTSPVAPIPGLPGLGLQKILT